MARVNQAAGTELTSEQVVKIKAAQKRHALIDPGCERLSPEEFINWHPVNGMTWEERTRLMQEAGIVDPEAASERDVVRERVLAGVL
jgi:dUTPase